jgi:RNA-directed DNA polymerase
MASKPGSSPCSGISLGVTCLLPIRRPALRRRELELDARFRECGLELHPEKTKIVYCKDDSRRKDYSVTSFDFLGYTFRPRRSKDRKGKFFINFSPAVSNKAGQGMRAKTRGWKMHLRSDKSLEDLSKMFSPVIRGWINYHGRFISQRCIQHSAI